ncbi:hypothetical protein SAMN02949497_3063 [Methylomagnum ishizawai]|uniref:Uncharacterized protein n=1 Tax=Methylomagnum ishizawai TaxID=1760988 RepID=A0A1Y6CYE9_9GAMM|nr:hypothetical protein SAMN02949497_3063 [Methylomagnum ishizawai]
MTGQFMDSSAVPGFGIGGSGKADRGFPKVRFQAGVFGLAEPGNSALRSWPNKPLFRNRWFGESGSRVSESSVSSRGFRNGGTGNSALRSWPNKPLFRNRWFGESGSRVSESPISKRSFRNGGTGKPALRGGPNKPFKWDADSMPYLRRNDRAPRPLILSLGSRQNHAYATVTFNVPTTRYRRKSDCVRHSYFSYKSCYRTVS